jgi:hypothetical protein
VPLHGLLENPRWRWWVGMSPEVGAEGAARAMDLVHYDRWHGVSHAAGLALHRTHFGEFFRWLRERLNQRLSQVATVGRTGDRFVENLLRNLPGLVGVPSVDGAAGAWEGRPAIVVASGPSLSRHLDRLREIENDTLLIAVGTAARLLVRAGIRPHVVVSLDPAAHNADYFEGVDLSGSVLVYDEVSCPAVAAMDARAKLSTRTNPVVAPFARAVLGPCAMLRAGGSVAHLGVGFALHMGADPVVLVGQDLAYTGQQSHASGYREGTQWESLGTEPSGTNRLEVECYGGGGVVETSFVLSLYRVWFEDLVGTLSEGRLINATEGGARIRGAREQTLDETLVSLRAVRREGEPEGLVAALSAVHVGGGVTSVVRALEQVHAEVTVLEEKLRKTGRDARGLLDGTLSRGARDVAVRRVREAERGLGGLSETATALLDAWMPGAFLGFQRELQRDEGGGDKVARGSARLLLRIAEVLPRACEGLERTLGALRDAQAGTPAERNG